MEARNRTWTLGLSAAIFVLACCCSGSSEAKAVVHPELEATDICLFTCEFCFRDEGLLNCANECLMTEGAMNALWRNACPYFALQPIFEVPPPSSPQQLLHHQHQQEQSQQQPLQELLHHVGQGRPSGLN